VIRRALASVAVLSALLAPFLGVPAASATGDDYPYRTDTTQSADPWGFTKRQCVSFAAWELKQHGYGISNATQHWGSAYTWDDTAKRLGKRISTTPKVGAIAQWNANESSRYYPASGGVGTMTAGPYGHVAYVTTVYGDGTVRIEQYNMGGNRAFSAMRVRAPRYLYVAG
jgi:surface antigen